MALAPQPRHGAPRHCCPQRDIVLAPAAGSAAARGQTRHRDPGRGMVPSGPRCLPQIPSSTSTPNPPAFSRAVPGEPKRCSLRPVEDCQHPGRAAEPATCLSHGPAGCQRLPDAAAAGGGAGTGSHRDASGYGDRALAPVALGRAPGMLRAALPLRRLHPRSPMAWHPADRAALTARGATTAMCAPLVPRPLRLGHPGARGSGWEHSLIQQRCEGC